MEVRAPFEMGDALAEVHRTAADSPVNIVTLIEKEFRQERTILAGDTGNEGRLRPVPVEICQVNVKHLFDLFHTRGAYADFSCKPARYSSLILAQHFGKLTLTDSLLAENRLNSVQKCIIYHNTKLRNYAELDNGFKDKFEDLTEIANLFARYNALYIICKKRNRPINLWLLKRVIATTP